MKTKSHPQAVLLRTTYFNGTQLETDRFFGVFPSADAAHERAQELDDMVFKNVAIKGLSFVFRVQEVTED